MAGRDEALPLALLMVTLLHRGHQPLGGTAQRAEGGAGARGVPGRAALSRESAR